MQTFLPYPDFTKSAQCLDNKRLGKQRVEAWQIYLSLTKKEYGWKNHPIVKMWREYERALLSYGLIICQEWRKRGFKDSLFDKFYKELYSDMPKILLTNSQKIHMMPSWLGNDQFHASHRSNLLRKDPEWYNKFGWTEPNNLPYVWIV